IRVLHVTGVQTCALPICDARQSVLHPADALVLADLTLPDAVLRSTVLVGNAPRTSTRLLAEVEDDVGVRLPDVEGARASGGLVGAKAGDRTTEQSRSDLRGVGERVLRHPTRRDRRGASLHSRLNQRVHGLVLDLRDAESDL